MFIKKIVSIIIAIIDSFVYSFKLSWQASKTYTVFRLLTRISEYGISFCMILLSSKMLTVLARIDENTKNMFVSLSIVTLLCVLIRIILNRMSEYIIRVHDERMQRHIEQELMEIAFTADIELFDSPEFYNQYEMARDDIYSIINAVWNAIDMITSLLSLVSAFFLLVNENAWIAFLLLFTNLPVAVITQKYTKKMFLWSIDYATEDRQLRYLSRNITSKKFAQDIRLYDIGTYIKNRYKVIWNLINKKKNRLARKRSILIALFLIVPEIFSFIFLLDVGNKIIIGVQSIGAYTLYSGLITQMNNGFNIAVFSAAGIYDNKLRLDNFKALKSRENNVKDTGKKQLNGIKAIEFCEVSFTYPNTEQPVLKKISFTINAKEKICIVGVNGAGKTTLLKLLLRFYDVDKGDILINGYSIKEYTLHSLRKSFSCFFQEFQNYAFTLRENIAISDLEKDASDNNIFQALKNGDASSILAQMPEGLDSYLSKQFDANGEELSGGQNQKVALARAFYRESEIILLDEPSSALDPEAEYKVFEQIEHLCQNKIAIFTSHRLSNTTMADRIIVLENGEIVETGTHEELIKKSARYATLFAYQAEKYIRNRGAGAK